MWPRHAHAGCDGWQEGEVPHVRRRVRDSRCQTVTAGEITKSESPQRIQAASHATRFAGANPRASGSRADAGVCAGSWA